MWSMELTTTFVSSPSSVDSCVLRTKKNHSATGGIGKTACGQTRLFCFATPSTMIVSRSREANHTLALHELKNGRGRFIVLKGNL
jgi:hypothetical protein